VFRECKPPPRPKYQQKVIWDSNPDFRINPYSDPDVCWPGCLLTRMFADPDVCWPGCLLTWMFAGSLRNVVDRLRYLISVSHFVECRENRPVTVWEMLINLLNPLLRNGEGSGNILPIVGPTITSSFSEIDWWLLHGQNDRHAHRMTDKRHWWYNLRLGGGNVSVK